MVTTPAKSEHIKTPDYYRQSEYLTNLHRRLDFEIRERQAHIKEQHNQLAVRKDELDKLHEQLLLRERIVANQQEKYKELLDLQHTVQDSLITAEYEKEQVKKLKEELRIKQNELIAREEEVMRLEKRAKEVKTSLLVDTHKHVDTMVSRIPNQISVDVKKIDETKIDKPLKALIHEAYDSLAKKDVYKARDIYKHIYTKYTQDKPQPDLHQDILDLHKDITLAMQSTYNTHSAD